MTERPSLFKGYYAVLKEKRRAQSQKRKKSKHNVRRRVKEHGERSSTFLTQFAASPARQCWKSTTLSRKRDEGKSDKEGERARVERKRREYYEKLRIKPGLLSLLPLTKRSVTISGRPDVTFRMPSTLIVTPDKVRWIHTNSKGTIVCKDLEQSVEDCIESFVAICKEQRESNGRTSKRRNAAPPFVAVRRVFRSGLMVRRVSYSK